ncbi:MAG: cytochrome c [Candidatus Thiodiazotropha sp. LLP2]
MNKPCSILMNICAIFFLTATISTANAQQDDLDGAQLYLAKACAGCHGIDGESPKLPLYPHVAGQNIGYLYNQLRDIKHGHRNNGLSIVMKGIMTAVSDEEMLAIATWLSKQ